MENNQEKNFKLLLNIHRAAHFEWIRAFEKLYPQENLQKMVEVYWDEVAKDTAKAYLKALDKNKPLANQIGAMIVKSSTAMGEEASLIEDDHKVVVEHKACPWWDWHKREGKEELDRPGCDTWFFNTVKYINDVLDSHVKIKTECTLADGDSCCKRIFWIDEG